MEKKVRKCNMCRILMPRSFKLITQIFKTYACEKTAISLSLGTRIYFAMLQVYSYIYAKYNHHVLCALLRSTFML